MKWRKLGRVFDPTQHQLPSGCMQFAQSPQALICDDHVRIFFSTRAKDPLNGKYLSHVAYVDFNPALSEVLRVSSRPVIGLGQLGSFDEHGIFPINVLRRDDRVLGYTTGWSRRVSVSVETAIGLVVSEDDGSTFRRLHDGPIMAASVEEPFLVGDAFVRVFHGIFHMWYIFGTNWKAYSAGAPPDRTYKIGHATSLDGVNWSRENGRQIIPDALGQDESQALPTVIDIDGEWHMFFCYRQSSGFRTDRDRGYRLGHACSKDLVTWRRNEEGVLSGTPGSWDADMQCYPHVFRSEGNVYMLYNGNEFGRLGFGLGILE